MAAPFHFEHSVAFSAEDPTTATAVLRAIPTLPGVFALHGPETPEGQTAQPYLTRTADLRRRITRLLAPPDSQSKRLNLRTRVARIDYTITGSGFESTLTLYHAASALFGLPEARRRLKLHTPFFLRFTAENAYPRVYSTNRLSKRALDNFYGPFPSRAAADRYCEAVLDLFQLRRCHEDLAPYPEHPGCIYGEMNKCLAPCNQACTPAGAAAYSAEAAAVKRFFDTRGESMIVEIGLAREEASSAMHFEKAAGLHAQWHKVKAAQTLADELAQSIPQLRAVIVQKATAPTITPEAATPTNSSLTDPGNGDCHPDPEPAEGEGPASSSTTSPEAEPTAALFLLHAGCLTGPARLSTLGVRAVKQQTSVGSSLFAQPLMLQAIPLATETQAAESLPGTKAIPALNPEARASALIASLEAQAANPTDLATLSDHLSLLRRWYYRPEKHRTGEIFFAKADGSFPNADTGVKGAWPIRRILNAAARAALGEPAPLAETNRDAAQRNPEDAAQKPLKTKTLHKGRPEVERTVPAIPSVSKDH